MRIVGRFAAGLLDQIDGMIEPGISTGEIDDFVDRETRKAGGISAPMGYQPRGIPTPFPKHCCTSVNHVVCHGIPSHDHILKEGDVVNVDVTPILDGFHGDTSRTFIVGQTDPETRRLVEDTYACMWAGIQAVKPGAHVGDIGYACQTYAESRGHAVVREFTGHGIGRVFHDAPTVLHVGHPGEGMELVPGLTFTIEPMLNAGHWRCEIQPDHWTVWTMDRGLSAQWEHTVSVTEDGVEIHTLSAREREERGLP